MSPTVTIQQKTTAEVTAARGDKEKMFVTDSEELSAHTKEAKTIFCSLRSEVSFDCSFHLWE